MAFLIENNGFSGDTYGIRSTRFFLLSANIATYAVDLAIPLEVQTWAAGASAAWQAKLASHAIEQGERFEYFQTSQESDRALLEQYSLLKELIIARYGQDNEMIRLYGCFGPAPADRDSLLNKAYILIETNTVQLAAGDPKALPVEMTNNLKTLADASKDDYTAAIKELREAKQSTVEITELYNTDSENLRNLYQWACAMWGKFDTRLLDLGFVQAKKQGGGQPGVPQNLAYDSANTRFSWDFVVEATSYEAVYKAASDIDWQVLYTGTDNAVVHDLGYGNWEVKVRARNANGYGDFCAPLSVEILAPLQAPTDVAVTWTPFSTTRTAISFTPHGATETIDLYQSLVPVGDPAGPYSLVGNFPAISPIRLGGVPNQRIYVYLVAKNSTQESDPSSVAYCDNV